jgi:DNA-binding NtrC family response regulator
MGRHILIVDDDELVLESLGDRLKSQGYGVSAASRVDIALKMFNAETCDAAIVDYELPDGTALDLIPKLKALDASIPVLVLTGRGTIDLAVKAIKLGAEQFITKDVELDVILELLGRALQNRRSRSRNVTQEVSRARYQRDPFLGSSVVIRNLRREAEKILGTNRPILIQGETGTGKGVLAQWLHKQGPRSDEAIVDLNCAGFSRELLDSELFGHEKGAFTGAVSQKSGLFDVANHGIVLLDEIGDLDPTIQPKLLKVLEEKRFRRVGGVHDRFVDVRLIAATNRDLREMVAQGKFREDLYFRISCLPLYIPPLRERLGDIPLIAEFLFLQLKHDLGRMQLVLSEDAVAALKSYSWPGNMRELRNVLERAALLSEHSTISARDLALPLLSMPKAEPGSPTVRQTLKEVERQHIVNVLNQEGGSVERAAAHLGIPRSTLYIKLKQLNILPKHPGQFQAIN